MDDSDPHSRTPPPGHSSRPLLGLTILVVEDSRFASEAMRLLCLRSGARIRRADCLRAARRHLQIYRPSAVIVDLGLPDGSGADLLAELAQASPRIDVLIGTSGDDGGEARARAAGADGFLAKPILSLASFQAEVLLRLPPDRRPIGPQILRDEAIRPDPIAYAEDLEHAAAVLGDEAAPARLDYLAQFVSGIARSIDDTPLAEAARDLARASQRGLPMSREVSHMAHLMRQRIDRRRAI